MPAGWRAPPASVVYGLLAGDERRNALILDDVIGSLEAGRSPIVLTERKDHLLAEHFPRPLPDEAEPGFAGAAYPLGRGEARPAGAPAERVKTGRRRPAPGPRRAGRGAYGEKDTVSGISVMPLYFSIASFMRFSLWPSRLFHSAHQFRKFLKVSSSSERMPK